MKRPLPCESAAAALALCGAFLLVAVYIPILNPGLLGMPARQALPSIGYYIVATPIPLAILVASWFLNQKARAIKRANREEPRLPESASELWLKWILAAFVIIVLASVFL